MKLNAHVLSCLTGPYLLQPGDAEEVEALWKYEVFLQDPIAIKDVLRVRQ